MCQTGHQREPGVGTSTKAFGYRQQQIGRRGGLLRGLRAQDLCQVAAGTFPEQVGNPLAITVQRQGFGMVPGRGHGKDSRGLGPWDPSAQAPPHLALAPWTGARRSAWAGRQLLSCCWPRASPIHALFLAPEEAEEKAKKGVAVLGRTLSWKRFQGPLGWKRQPPRHPKILCLNGAGRGRRLSGARGGHRWGTPGLLHTLGSRKLQQRTETQAQHHGSRPVTKLR